MEEGRNKNPMEDMPTPSISFHSSSRDRGEDGGYSEDGRWHDGSLLPPAMRKGRLPGEILFIL